METSISVRLLVDASRSMDHRDGDFTKLDYARHLAAALAWLAHSQGDAIGLYIFREGQVYATPARRDPQHLARLFYQLEQLTTGGVVGDIINYKHIFLGEQKRELLIFISDLYETSGEIGRLLELLAALRHEIIVFQLWDRDELEFPFSRWARFENLEKDDDFLLLDPAAIRQRYLQILAKFREQLLEGLRKHQVDLVPLITDEPLVNALKSYLALRARH